MCAARAIDTAVSVLNKDRWTSAQLQSLRKSRKLQEREALKLHQDSGVPMKDEGNDFADLKTFAKHLGVGLKVFSGDVFGEICFETGELNDQTVCLLKNGIISMSSLLFRDSLEKITSANLATSATR